jgi:hypothetical protein
MKASEVYFRGDTVFVNTMAKTVPGFLIRSGPMFKFKRDEEASAFGEAVLKTLDSFQEGVPMLQAPSTAGKEFLEFAGVKSWSTFARNALHLSIAFDGREVSVIPTTRAHGGFDHLTDQAVKTRPEPRAVGEALLEALKLCS